MTNQSTAKTPNNADFGVKFFLRLQITGLVIIPEGFQKIIQRISGGHDNFFTRHQSDGKKEEEGIEFNFKALKVQKSLKIFMKKEERLYNWRIFFIWLPSEVPKPSKVDFNLTLILD